MEALFSQSSVFFIIRPVEYSDWWNTSGIPVIGGKPVVLNTSDAYLIVMDPGSPNFEVCYGVQMPNGPDSDISNWIASLQDK